MDPRDFVTQIKHLDLTPADVAFLTGTDESWCVRIHAGEEPVPHWLHLLTVLWAHDADALHMSREVAEAMEEGGPTSDTVANNTGIAVVGATMD